MDARAVLFDEVGKAFRRAAKILQDGKSQVKAVTSRENGKKGGRPPSRPKPAKNRAKK